MGRIPIATYRLQLSAHVGLAEARTLVPYLHRLGVSDLYLSPVFRARRGSLHGYDVTDHNMINPELGTEADMEALLHTLQQHGMGCLLDIVPNHMGIGDETNRWWYDVLENGPSSLYAGFFDIDWQPPKHALHNKVLLPVLGEQYGQVLEQGDLRLCYDEGAFWVSFYDQRLPLAPRTWSAILEPTLERLGATLSSEDPHLIELESILTALRHLPLQTETDPEKVRERQREKEVGKRRLAHLLNTSLAVHTALQATLLLLNGQKGDAASFDQLEAILAAQPYRLCYWRVAADEVNYRRFFEVNDLAAIRVEQPEVFEAVHALVFRLIRQGGITGLRIDHPDGLLNPEQYFVDLQAGYRQALAAAAPATVVPPEDAPRASPYIVIEKILGANEPLRQHWAVQGTTGYDFLNLVNGLFVAPDGRVPVREVYARFTGLTQSAGEVAYASKLLILQVSMASELHRLARCLERISEQHRWSRDFTLFSLQEALREVVACFPVYRTYTRVVDTTVDSEDRYYIIRAINTAKLLNPALSESLFDFIASLLFLEEPPGLSAAQRSERLDFVLRFQQLTGSVMAKGVEDTAFYRSYPLLSLNEVGGTPERFGVTVDTFHQANAERLTQWPGSLLSTSTHDTKRGEDVRARINVLSEVPDEWERAIQRWQQWNQEHKTLVNGLIAPDANEEYLFYQTLVGTWPLSPVDETQHERLVRRMIQYMEKALKEAKIHSSWINPQVAYDQAVRSFVEQTLNRQSAPRFLADFERFQARIAPLGCLNSLAQTLLKLTSPGVPDVYQGTELWDDSLVDPDNRRPLDFTSRSACLQALQEPPPADLLALVQELLAQWWDGRMKLYVTSSVLQFRRRHHALFQHGSYLPLEASGSRGRHVVAFARYLEPHWSLVVVPRLVAAFASRRTLAVAPKVWGKSVVSLPTQAPTLWHNVLTGETLTASVTSQTAVLPLGTLLQHCPVALLSTAPVAASQAC
ncbi:MAG: malto-oligosyltrehalose synthase [Candidatus Tectimicrobiota bacterium]